MRCFCCDNPANYHDTDTGRMYCSECWDVIEELIRQDEEREILDTDLWVTEVDMEEFDEQSCSRYTPNVS